MRTRIFYVVLHTKESQTIDTTILFPSNPIRVFLTPRYPHVALWSRYFAKTDRGKVFPEQVRSPILLSCVEESRLTNVHHTHFFFFFERHVPAGVGLLATRVRREHDRTRGRQNVLCRFFWGGGSVGLSFNYPLRPECFRVVIPPARVSRSWFGNLVDLKWHPSQAPFSRTLTTHAPNT